MIGKSNEGHADSVPVRTCSLFNGGLGLGP
jgi:hypothetical protein